MSTRNMTKNLKANRIVRMTFSVAGVQIQAAEMIPPALQPPLLTHTCTHLFSNPGGIGESEAAAAQETQWTQE